MEFMSDYILMGFFIEERNLDKGAAWRPGGLACLSRVSLDSGVKDA